MPDRLPNCKITIIKRNLNKDLINQFVVDAYQGMGPCEIFQDNQEIIIDPNLASVPENFCDWAWADIRKDIITIASGGNVPGMKQPGTMISSCSDWFRNVIFRIERIK